MLFTQECSWTQGQAVPLVHGVIHFSLSLSLSVTEPEQNLGLEVHDLHLIYEIRGSDYVEATKVKKGRDAEDCGGKWTLWCYLGQLLNNSVPSHQKDVLDKTFLKGAFLV